MAAYGYKAILELEGEKPIAVDECSYTYVRDVNEKTGKVQSGVSGGIINLVYIDHPSNVIWEWAMTHKLKNGSLKVMQTDSNSGTYVPEEEVKLKEAVCATLNLDYFRHGSSHFCTRLTITSNKSAVGDTEDGVSKKWKLI
jgi:hypothetical protein